MNKINHDKSWNYKLSDPKHVWFSLEEKFNNAKNIEKKVIPNLNQRLYLKKINLIIPFKIKSRMVPKIILYNV